MSEKSAFAGLKREWIIGQHLNKLRGPKGELQGTVLYARLFATDVCCTLSVPGNDSSHIVAGFMGTGAAVIRKSDKGLEGLILEKVNGAPLEKRYASHSAACSGACQSTRLARTEF